jgi:hypothetical protein
MRKIIFLLLLLCWYSIAHTQNLIILNDSERLTAQKIDEKMWLVQMEGEDYFLIQRSAVDTLTKRINIKNAIIERHMQVIAAQDTLLKKFSKFEDAADRHIATQKELIVTADSLFTGYQSLYHDIKKVFGLTTFSIVPGFAFVDPPRGDWRPIGAIGIDYHQWLTQYHFGKDYQGILVAYRVSLGW